MSYTLLTVYYLQVLVPVRAVHKAMREIQKPNPLYVYVYTRCANTYT